MKKLFLFAFALLTTSLYVMADTPTTSVAKVKFKFCFTTYADESQTISTKRLPYLWNEQNCTQSGVFLSADGTNERGCDHYQRLTLTVDNNFEYDPETLKVTVLESKLPYTWSLNGEEYDEEGVYQYVSPRTTVDGNDVVHTLELSVKVIPQGAIPGEFIVGYEQDGTTPRKVYFSQGNLRYVHENSIAFPNEGCLKHMTVDGEKAGEFSFAPEQYDILKSAVNSNTTGNQYSMSDNNRKRLPIDYFRWATSGKDEVPYALGGTNTAYGDALNDMTGDYADYDWGWYNAIKNGGNQIKKWRTLTITEWSFLMDNLQKQGRIYLAEFGPSVNKIQGWLLLPENWAGVSGVNLTSSYNSFTTEQWGDMQSAGAVFLPWTSCQTPNIGSFNIADTKYWSASSSTDSNGFSQVFCPNNTSGGGAITVNFNRTNGCPVRLVQDL